MSWRDQARAAINRVDASLPDDATDKQVRAALRKAASDFHCPGTSWPAQVWQDERRKYLARRCDPGPLPLEGRGADLGRLKDRIASGDVTFPFRDQTCPAPPSD